MSQRPDLTPLHLPLPLSDFQSSPVGADDDLVDLDVVRAVVLDTARLLHPGAEVWGGEVVFQRAPRERGRGQVRFRAERSSGAMWAWLSRFS
jgi:hypothetical protein